jgi:hypothetical protein
MKRTSLAIRGERSCVDQLTLATLGECFTMLGECFATLGECFAMLGECFTMLGGRFAMLGECFATLETVASKGVSLVLCAGH